MTLQAVFANPNNTLRPGLYAKVRGAIDTKKGAIVVPQRAVRELQGVQQIAVVAPDGKVDVRNCTMGPRVGSSWIVEKCLAPGDKVVIEGLQKIKTGMQVTTKAAPTPPPPGSTPPPGSASVGAP
jgi:membrane fusion protein (multidrug efflux system)